MLFEIVSCPAVGTHSIWRCNENKTVIIDNMMRDFTPIEYRLLVPLLEHHQASDDELAEVDTLVKQIKSC